MAASNKTLLKAIERKGKQIAKQKQKLRWSKSIKDRDKAREEIARLSSEELRMRQQIRYNQASGDNYLQECE